MKDLRTLFLNIAAGFFLVLSSILVTQTGWAGSEALKTLAIQDGGRLKPFDTFSREAVQLMTGSQDFHSKDPNELVLSWLVIPDEWQSQKFIKVGYIPLKQKLGFKVEESFFSPAELIHNQELMKMFGELENIRKEGGKVPPFYQKVAEIGGKLTRFQEVVSGKGLKLVPVKDSNDWQALSDLPEEGQRKFLAISDGLITLIKDGNDQKLIGAVSDFKNYAKSQAPEKYLSDEEIEREVWYNSVHPFRKAWISYLIGLLLMFAGAFVAKSIFKKVGLVFIGLGFASHVLGFTLRCLIAGRPPVSNMYESMIWVGFGAVFFGAIIALIYKKYAIVASTTFVGFLCVLLADSLPAVLDASIQPLQPVLRSNYWLTIHVLTITASYAAFMAALGVSNYALGFSVFKRPNAKEMQRQLGIYTYRLLQIGVVLLAAGTILGGVWADYSWGRFWGWDPKETWALIALLLYLAVLHGRLVGWVNVFRLHACAILCFSGVVMAWYGVNFVLGVGLHSYGFGAGGVEYVGAVILLQAVYVGVASLRSS